MERESVLDRYFKDISVEQVDSEEEGVEQNRQRWLFSSVGDECKER